MKKASPQEMYKAQWELADLLCWELARQGVPACVDIVIFQAQRNAPEGFEY